MKKFFILRLLGLLIYLAFVVVVNKIFNVSSIYVVIGGLLGLFILNIDQLIYIFFIHQNDLSSQRAMLLIKDRKLIDFIRYVFDTRYERKNLVFHSSYFPIIFFSLTFWIVTSTSSQFVKGLALGACIDLTFYLFDWYKNKSEVITIDNSVKIYLMVNVLLLFIFSFLF